MSSITEIESNEKGEEGSLVRKLLTEKETWRPYGNLRVFCGGCIIVSPVRSWWWILELYTLAVSAVFFYEYDKQETIYLPIIGAVGFLICMISSWKTLLCDPGVLQRPSFEQALQNAAEIDILRKAGIYPSKSVEIRNLIVNYTYCLDCHHYRSSRTGHCHVCDICVEEFDHHCPIYGGCVGRRNHLAFQIMSFSLSLYHTFLLVCGVYVAVTEIKRKGKNTNFWTSSITLDLTIIAIGLACLLPAILSQLPCESDPPRRRFSHWQYKSSHARTFASYAQLSQTAPPNLSNATNSERVERNDSNGNHP